MRVLTVILLLTGLAACGVDGAPERPTDDTPPVGVSITGKAEVGVTGGSTY